MYRKILCLMLAATVSAGVLSGCSISFGSGETSSSAESDVSSKESNKKGIHSDDESAQDVSDVESKPTQNVSVSDNWKDYEIVFDGAKLKFPFDFKELEKLGWSIDFDDFDSEDTEIDSGNEMSSVTLTNDKFNDFFVSADLANVGSEACDITDCKVTALYLDAMFVDGNIPEVTLAGGITWGSTIEELVAAYGEPEDEPFANEEMGYYHYDYFDSIGFMEIVPFKEGGVKRIAIYYNDIDVSEKVDSKVDSSNNSSKNESSKNESKSESNSNSKPTGNANVSENWKDLQFEFDGHIYSMMFDYKDLADAGWTFDLADYGYEDGYILNKGDSLSSTIDLESDKFDADVYVGITNAGDKACDVTEGKIWAFECDVSFAEKELPSLTLPKGITWGSTVEQIEAAYGKPEQEPYYSEALEYYSYEYETESGNSLSLIIYKDGGLKEFELKCYEFI